LNKKSFQGGISASNLETVQESKKKVTNDSHKMMPGNSSGGVFSPKAMTINLNTVAQKQGQLPKNPSTS
jgi:hypothetical protein